MTEKLTKIEARQGDKHIENTRVLIYSGALCMIIAIASGIYMLI